MDDPRSYSHRPAALEKPFNLTGKDFLKIFRKVNIMALKKILKWPKKDTNG